MYADPHVIDSDVRLAEVHLQLLGRCLRVVHAVGTGLAKGALPSLRNRHRLCRRLRDVAGTPLGVIGDPVGSGSASMDHIRKRVADPEAHENC
jgi:hypothetical protein